VSDHTESNVVSLAAVSSSKKEQSKAAQYFRDLADAIENHSLNITKAIVILMENNDGDVSFKYNDLYVENIIERLGMLEYAKQFAYAEEEIQ